jgi:hypothetical protein
VLRFLISVHPSASVIIRLNLSKNEH